jgi:hypothetical protein
MLKVNNALDRDFQCVDELIRRVVLEAESLIDLLVEDQDRVVQMLVEFVHNKIPRSG